MYTPEIIKNPDGSFFALVVRVEPDGGNVVVRGYKSRHFKTQKAALKSTKDYIKKHLS